MSSLELPRVTLAHAAAALLCVLCAACIEAVIQRHPAAPPGAGIAAGLGALAWLCHETLRASRALLDVAWQPDGTWLLRFRDGRIATAQIGPATRVLGRALFLDWRAEDCSVSRLLTRWDVEDERLRAMSVRLACSAGLQAR
jgi:hypothetical protein